MKTLYIFKNGIVLRRIGRCLIAERSGERILECPIKDIERILIYGQSEISSKTLDILFEHNISVHFTKRSGRLKGKITPITGKHVTLRQKQYKLAQNKEKSTDLAKIIVESKIRNMEVIINHLFRRKKGAARSCMPLRKTIKNLSKCKEREEIMGVEGAATRHYFSIYGEHFPDPFAFRCRSRRPANDPANAMLNLGYMTLFREVFTHVEAHCLDPYCGVLHTTYEKRPALPLDIMEEFRQPLIDLFVIKLFRRGQLKQQHFENKSGDVLISETGFQVFFREYEKQMGRQDGCAPGLRKAIDEQVQLFKYHVTGELNYQPFALENESDSLEKHKSDIDNYLEKHKNDIDNY